MLDYIIKTEIAGIEIRVVYSNAADTYYVTYGLQKTGFTSLERALEDYNECVTHAINLR